MDDQSSYKFFKSQNDYLIKQGLKIINKSFVFEKIIENNCFSWQLFKNTIQSMKDKLNLSRTNDIYINDKIIKKKQIKITGLILDFILNQMLNLWKHKTIKPF